METNRKRRRGDRKDAYLLRDLDAMHKFIPYLLPNRCDNEAVMSELIDLTAVNEYVAKRMHQIPHPGTLCFMCSALLLQKP